MESVYDPGGKENRNNNKRKAPDADQKRKPVAHRQYSTDVFHHLPYPASPPLRQDSNHDDSSSPGMFYASPDDVDEDLAKLSKNDSVSETLSWDDRGCETVC